MSTFNSFFFRVLLRNCFGAQYFIVPPCLVDDRNVQKTFSLMNLTKTYIKTFNCKNTIS